MATPKYKTVINSTINSPSGDAAKRPAVLHSLSGINPIEVLTSTPGRYSADDVSVEHKITIKSSIGLSSFNVDQRFPRREATPETFPGHIRRY